MRTSGYTINGTSEGGSERRCLTTSSRRKVIAIAPPILARKIINKMKEIIINNQEEFDEVKIDFEGIIRIQGSLERIDRCFVGAEIRVSGNATIQSVYGNATIQSVSGNATIKYVYGNATIQSVYDDATIQSVYDDATIVLMAYASVLIVYSCKSIITRGRNIVRYFKENKSKITLELSKETTEIVLPKCVVEKEYFSLYPVEMKDSKAIFYKAVHKDSDGYFSENTNSFRYEIGKIYKEEIDKNNLSCGKGLHVAHKLWAITFGRGWDDMALLECEVDPKDIYVAEGCGGKCRTGKLKVIREVPQSEW